MNLIHKEKNNKKMDSYIYDWIGKESIPKVEMTLEV